MSDGWRSFWAKYRAIEPRSEDDLFVQVGKTVQGRPIDPHIFAQMVERIVRKLDLRADDTLVDLCCGNGVITFELAGHVRRIVAVDFSTHLIASARSFKAAPNIAYREADVAAAIGALMAGEDAPTVALMNDSLAYFDPAGLDAILRHIAAGARSPRFRFLITGIPDDARKSNFYDTPERMARYVENARAGSDVNDGMGRWWKASEIAAAAAAVGLLASVEPQPTALSNYRMDALLTWQ